jgi:outer membrane biosynthesis protein TonB
MAEVVYPNIKPVVTPDGAESYLSVRNVVSVVVVILFVVAMAWLYYKLLDKDKKIRDLEAGLFTARKKSSQPPPDDIESQLPAATKQQPAVAPAPAPTPAPTPTSKPPTESAKPPQPTPAAPHIAIVEGVDDAEVDKYL